MKFLFLSLAAATMAAPPAFAFKKVQFDADIRLELCPLEKDGTCKEIDPGPFVVHETVIADEVSGPDSETSPFRSVSATKSYRLTRLFGATYDLDLNVDFFHEASGEKPLVMAVTLGQASDPGGLRPQDHAATVSLPDLGTFHRFTIQGETKVQKMPVAPDLALTPSVWISNVKVLE